MGTDGRGQQVGESAGSGDGLRWAGSAAAATVGRAVAEWLAERGGDALTEVSGWALASPGKLLRPVLLVESAAAVGGRREEVLPAAVGMELLHVGSLVHDDIVDGDELRRGRPAVHRRFGTPLAILAGDGLLFAAFEQVARCAERGVPARAVQQAVGVLAAAGRDMAEGVARELGWTTTVQGAGCASALADYAETARLKTAALLRASCEMGALLGGGGARQVRALAAYGQALGIAFQIRDDLLPYTSTAAREGKPADSDLRNARPALPLVLVGALGDARARTRLTALLADDPSARHEELAALLEETGALKQAQVIAQEYALQCHQALDDLPPGPHSQVLRDLIAAVTATDDADADADVPGTDIGRQR